MGKLIDATCEGNSLNLVLKCSRLDAASARDFKSEFLESWQDGISAIEIDFDAVDFIDSSGIGALLSAHKKLDGDGVVKLTRVKSQVKAVIELLRLNRIFEITE